MLKSGEKFGGEIIGDYLLANDDINARLQCHAINVSLQRRVCCIIAMTAQNCRFAMNACGSQH